MTPTGPGLSGRLKHLQNAEAPLSRPGFDIDDVIRGGRRRRRNRNAAVTVAAAAAVITLGAGLVATRSGDSTGPPIMPAAPAVSTAPNAPALSAVDLAEDRTLTYEQADKTVTVTRKDGPVATITLASTTYTATGGQAVFTVETARPLTVDTSMFLLYDASGGENTPGNHAKLHLNPGRHTISLIYTETGAAPQAVGWAAADGYAVWPR